jgi:phage terminase small subunit
MARRENGLTDRQNKFVQEYLIDQNGLQAARRAGFGYKSAGVAAHKMLKDGKIARAVAVGLKEQQERCQVTADMVLKRLWQVGNADLRKAFDDEGILLPVDQIPEEVAQAISGIDVDDLFGFTNGRRKRIGETKRVRTYDKVRALEALGKHFKLFVERSEVSGPNGEPIRLSHGIDLSNIDEKTLKKLANAIGIDK